MGNRLISSLVFVPPETTYTSKHPYPVTWLITKNRRKVPAYWMRSKVSDTKQTIVYSHGNAADIGAMYEFSKLLHDNLDINLLCYDYIGYGLAKEQGAPTEAGVYESIEAAMTFLRFEHAIDPKDVIIFGTSVGSGPSCHIASKLGVRGLILECPFTSVVKVVTATRLGRVVDMFMNIEKISSVECPVLIFHGKRDEVVPFDHGAALFDKVQDAYKYKFVELEEAGHHDIIDQLTLYEYVKTIHDFINHCERFYQDNKNSTVFQKNNIKDLDT